MLYHHLYRGLLPSIADIKGDYEGSLLKKTGLKGKSKKRYFFICGRYLYEFFDYGVRQKEAHRKYDLIATNLSPDEKNLSITINFPKPDEPITLILSNKKIYDEWFDYITKGMIPPDDYDISSFNQHQIKNNSLLELIRHREPWFINIKTENLIPWSSFESPELLIDVLLFII